MNIPPWMCHTVFDKELNGNDINLLYVLISMCSKTLNDENTFSAPYTMKEIMEKLNTKTNIKEGLKKLDGLKMTVNYLRSYTIDKNEKSKERKVITPFVIKINEDKNGKTKNVTITVDEDFIKAFKNPKPKFTLSFRYLKNIKNIQSQLLYMFLADRIAKKRKRTRHPDVRDLAEIMNRPRDYDLEEIKEDIRDCKAKFEEVDVDIRFDGKIKLSKNPNIDYKCSFDIIRVKKMPSYNKAPKEEEKDFVAKTHFDDGLTDEDIDLANKLIVNIIDFHIQDYKENNNKPIAKMIGFKRTIKAKHFLDESKKEILEIDAYIKEEIDTIVNNNDITIDNSHLNSLAFSNNMSDFYQVNNSYFIYKNKEQITTTIKETHRFLKKENLTPCVISNPYPQFSISSISMKSSKKQSDEQQQDNTNTVNSKDTDYSFKEELDEIDNQCNLDIKEQSENIDNEDEISSEVTEGLKCIFKNRLKTPPS